MFYCFNPNDEVPIFYIIGSIKKGLLNITEESKSCIYDQTFMSEFSQVDALGKSKILLCFNSSGGEAEASWNIAEIIKNAKTKTIGYNFFMVASAANHPFIECKERWAIEDAKFMIHNAHIDNMPNPPESIRRIIEIYNNKTLQLFKIKGKIDEKKIKAMLDAETYMNAKEALEYGFIDKIANIGTTQKEIIEFEQKLKFNLTIKQYLTDENKKENNNNNNKKNKIMEAEILQQLGTGLGTNANLISIMQEIANLKIKIVQAETAGATSTTDMEKLKVQLKQLTDDNEKMKQENDVMKKENEEYKKEKEQKMKMEADEKEKKVEQYLLKAIEKYKIGQTDVNSQKAFKENALKMLQANIDVDTYILGLASIGGSSDGKNGSTNQAELSEYEKSVSSVMQSIYGVEAKK